MKRICRKSLSCIVLAVLLALLSVMSVGCNGGKTGASSLTSSTKDPNASADPANPLDTIEIRDFGGRDFTLLTCVNLIWDVEEETNKFENEIAGDPIAEV